MSWQTGLFFRFDDRRERESSLVHTPRWKCWWARFEEFIAVGLAIWSWNVRIGRFESFKRLLYDYYYMMKYMNSS